MSEAKKSELAIRDKAILHQQRRLKQATQFTHKDSADLLPLDGLKRLGTSKDLQPHSIVQRRLLEGNITRLRGEARDASARVRSPLADPKDGQADAEERSESTADDSTEERESLEESERSLRSDEEDDSSEAAARQTAQKTELTALVVQCKCCETEIKASINTGSQHNHISTSCCQRLGLVPKQASSPCGALSSVLGLKLQLGTQMVQCSAHVKEDETSELCLGLQTLLELKCCLDLCNKVLKLQGGDEELPFLSLSPDSQCQHDTNENL
ncbi:nuclear receptor-interacting protein 2 [Takifugu rubripes]|uniref:Nuclear receptor interacting protein 2 n=1 Tax=Takifugu rubripes TaxID=31033 RepID=A0A3B5K4L9_TAKRU|nr:nuclear receptor-interacting protein 2 [Takifugu rubripes]|eukprot:XP_003972801.1 PREDICTED: nuclear receptor-interacting protein 2 [Takifugu rubripes]